MRRGADARPVGRGFHAPPLRASGETPNPRGRGVEPAPYRRTTPDRLRQPVLPAEGRAGMPAPRTAGHRSPPYRTALLLASLPLALAPAAAAQPWPCFRGAADGGAWRSFALPSARALPGWEFRPPGQVRGYVPGGSVWGSPSVARLGNDVIAFAGSYDHNVYAIGVLDGRERWRYATGGPVTATPAVAQVGGRWTVFFGSADRTLYCVEAKTGRKVWARQVLDWRQTVGRGTVASPLLLTPGGRTVALFAFWVYDQSPARPLERGALRACDAATGNLLWQAELGPSRPTSPVAAEVDGTTVVLVATTDGNVHCLDAATGRPRWKETLQGSIEASPAVTGGPDPLVLIGTRYGTFHALHARTGDEAWRYRAGQWVDSSAAVATVGGRDVAFFGSHAQALCAVEAGTGRPLWTFDTKGDVYSSPSVLRVAGRPVVAFTSGDDTLYLVDAASGREVWRTVPGRYLWEYRVIGDGIWASPVGVEVNGTTLVLLPFYDGVFHCYRADVAAVARLAGNPGYGAAMVRRALVAAVVAAALAVALVRRDRRRDETIA